MADDLDKILNKYGSSEDWRWRSDMNAPAPGDLRGSLPEARATAPRYPSDNIGPMAHDALAALGASPRDAMHYGNKIGSAAPWLPPVGFVDAAASVGRPLHEGKPSEAAGNAAILNALARFGGGAARAFLPPLTQGQRAASLEAMYPDDLPAILRARTSAMVNPRLGVLANERDRLSMEVGGLRAGFDRGVPANINDRQSFHRPFDVINGGGARPGARPDRDETLSRMLSRVDEASRPPSNLAKVGDGALEMRSIYDVIAIRDQQRAIVNKYGGNLAKAPPGEQAQFHALDEKAKRMSAMWDNIDDGFAEGGAVADWRSDMNARSPYDSRPPLPEAKPYDFPWYDDVASKLTDVAYGPNANARDFASVKHLVGPENPLNLPAQFTQGYSMASQGVGFGDPEKIGYGALSMAMSLPFGVRPGIKAFHVSPHKFDKFDLSKRKTGEGAQAYGDGAYFAESPAVSGKGGQYYRNFQHDPRYLELDDGTVLPLPVDDQSGGVARLRPGMPAEDRARIFAAGANERGMSEPIFRLANILRQEEPLTEFQIGGGWGDKEILEQTLARLKELRDAGAKPRDPFVYEVNIAADKDRFIDWDKPLRDQPQFIEPLAPIIGKQNAELRHDWQSRIADSYKSGSPVRRRSALRLEREGPPMVRSVQDIVKPRVARDAGDLSASIKDAGIPGIVYDDAVSRGIADPAAKTRNYVVFDADIVDILKRYGIPVGAMGAGAAAGQHGDENGG